MWRFLYTEEPPPLLSLQDSGMKSCKEDACNCFQPRTVLSEALTLLCFLILNRNDHIEGLRPHLEWTFLESPKTCLAFLSLLIQVPGSHFCFSLSVPMKMEGSAGHSHPSVLSTVVAIEPRGYHNARWVGSCHYLASGHAGTSELPKAPGAQRTAALLSSL